MRKACEILRVRNQAEGGCVPGNVRHIPESLRETCPRRKNVSRIHGISARITISPICGEREREHSDRRARPAATGGLGEQAAEGEGSHEAASHTIYRTIPNEQVPAATW